MFVTAEDKQIEGEAAYRLGLAYQCKGEQDTAKKVSDRGVVGGLNVIKSHEKTRIYHVSVHLAAHSDSAVSISKTASIYNSRKTFLKVNNRAV